METKAHQAEDEEGHEQEHEHLKGQNDPRCLKWGAWRASLYSGEWEWSVKRGGLKSEFSTTERGSTPPTGENGSE